eukprot:4763597-Pyramimonas_sp.AAC.1
MLRRTLAQHHARRHPTIQLLNRAVANIPLHRAPHSAPRPHDVDGAGAVGHKLARAEALKDAQDMRRHAAE